MSHTPPSRAVKCQICSWKGIRKYGPDGILCDPCPECGRLVTYGAPWAGDQPVTQDTGQPVRPRKRKRMLSPERKAALLAGLANARALRASR
jgi:hypothetical protein